MTAVQHYLASPVVTVEGDRATNRVYDAAFITPKGIRPGGSTKIVGGVWTVRAVRFSGTWFISGIVSEIIFQSPWQDDLAAFVPQVLGKVAAT